MQDNSQQYYRLVIILFLVAAVAVLVVLWVISKPAMAPVDTTGTATTTTDGTTIQYGSETDGTGTASSTATTTPGTNPTTPVSTTPTTNPNKPTITKMPGLTIEDTLVGTGAEAMNGDLVAVHYTGTLTNGTKFDSSLDRGAPIEFPLGTGYVIKGWDQGILGMKVGGKRKLTISPEMGYGSRAMGIIPPNSTLIFTVELMGVKKQ